MICGPVWELSTVSKIVKLQVNTEIIFSEDLKQIVMAGKIWTFL